MVVVGIAERDTNRPKESRQQSPASRDTFCCMYADIPMSSAVSRRLTLAEQTLWTTLDTEGYRDGLEHCGPVPCEFQAALGGAKAWSREDPKISMTNS